MKKHPNRLLAVFLLFTLTFVSGCYLAANFLLDRPVRFSESLNLDAEGKFLISIDKGSNLKQVNSALHSLNIIDFPWFYTWWARIFQKSHVQAGDYWVLASDTPRSLLDKFILGKVARHNVTFPEGWSFKQWVARLAQIPQYSFLADIDQATLLASIGAEISHPEGWFFPDTYSYSKHDNVVDIFKQAHTRMRVELDRAWQARDKDLPYKSAYEALIMASIIEKETGVAEERRAISGVFVRRLKMGMRLQTDPTVIYGMGDRYRGDIRRSDLRALTPYNTYRIDGLPPTPIAMPGLASIEAALHPLPGSSLYFVARGDGSHQFSDTISEHQQAVKKFQIEQRVQNYQSAPQ